MCRQRIAGSRLILWRHYCKRLAAHPQLERKRCQRLRAIVWQTSKKLLIRQRPVKAKVAMSRWGNCSNSKYREKFSPSWLVWQDYRCVERTHVTRQRTTRDSQNLTQHFNSTCSKARDNHAKASATTTHRRFTHAQLG